MVLDFNDPIHAWKKKIKWDITHEEALRRTDAGVFCFDPDLSYESTGYRPITQTQGLDFDPTEFTKVGKVHMQSAVKFDEKRYTTMFPGTKKHVEWWATQHENCKLGMVHNNYRITGDHYFFLNY